MGDTPQPIRQATARFADQLERLRRWLTDALGAPPIDDALVVELARDEIAAPRLRLASGRLKAPDAFEARWAELLAGGYAWINLSCYGLHGRTMIAAIELPREPTGAPWTSVNLSGPPHDALTNRPGWDGRDRIQVDGPYPRAGVFKP